MPRLLYTSLNTVLANIFFPLGKMIGMANKFHSVKPVLVDWQSSYRRCRKDEVVLCCARISNTHLTHSYILRKDPLPQCEHCQCILTVRLIFIQCNCFAQEGKI